MQGILLVIAVVFATISALIHVLIFFLESVLWSRPVIWRRFGVKSQGDADVVRPMAYNQGFYNLFLALGAGLGLTLMGWSSASVGGVWQGGIWVLLFALFSMLLASIVLISTNRRLWRSVLIQGLAPVLAIVFLFLTIATAEPIVVLTTG